MTVKKSILEVIIDPSGAKSGAKEATDAYDKFVKNTSEGSEKVQSAFDKMANSLLGGVRKMKSGWDKFTSAVGTAGAFVFNKFKDVALSVIRSVTKGITNLLSYLGPLGLLGAMHAIINAGIKIQKFTVAFSVITGSLEAAKNELQGIIEVSQKLGVAFDAAAAPFAKFFAAARNAITSADIREIFKSFSEVSVALHLNKQEVTGVFLALQQIASKGRVSMEELRLQLAERVPGAMRFAAQSMKMNMLEFEDAVRKGTINASEFLINYGKVLHEEFGPAAEKAAKLTQAALNRLDLSMMLFLNRISESGVMDQFTRSVNLLRTRLFESSTIADILGKALSLVLKKVNDFVSELSKEDMLDVITAVANAFVVIYNTVLDLIPKLSTMAKAMGTVAGWVNKTAEWFDGSGKARSEKIETLNRQIEGLNSSFNTLKESFKAIDPKKFADPTSELFKSWEKSAEAATIRLNKLKSELASLMKEAEGPTKLTPFDKESFRPDKAPSVGDASNLPGELDLMQKLEDIGSSIREANDILVTETVSKISQAEIDLADAFSRMNKLRADAMKSDLEISLADQMIAAQGLVKATQDYVKQRDALDVIISESVKQDQEALKSTVTSTVESLSTVLSFGKSAMRDAIDDQKNIIARAANEGLIEKERANELLEAMELKHQARMGSISAQGALNIKEFETKTFQQKVNTVIGLSADATAKMDQSNRKSFELNKKARLAQAVMELPAAVMSSYTKAGGWPWGIIPAALTLAAGLQNIQNIRSSTFSSTSAASSSTATAASSPIPPMSDALFNSTTNGEETQVVDTNPTSEPDVNITFKIDMLDTSTINTALIKAKPVIAKVVQDVYTERAKPGGPLS